MKKFAQHYHANHLGNCAQSVGAAWANAHKKDINEVTPRFAACGGGGNFRAERRHGDQSVHPGHAAPVR